MNARTRCAAEVAMLSMLIGGLACSSNAAEPDRFPGNPVVSTELFEDAPAPPAGVDLRMVCQDGPGVEGSGQANPSPNCPVIRWGEYTYWVFSNGSNGSSMTVVAYDALGNDRHSVTRDGARYLWKIESGAGVVTLYGQRGFTTPNGQTIVLTWDELKF